MRYFLGVLHYKHIPPYPPDYPQPCFLHESDSHCASRNHSRSHVQTTVWMYSSTSCDTISPHVSPHIFRWHIPCYVCACVPCIHWLPLLFVYNIVVYMHTWHMSGIHIALLPPLAVEYSSYWWYSHHPSTFHAIIHSLYNHTLTLSGIAGTVLAYVYSPRQRVASE